MTETTTPAEAAERTISRVADLNRVDDIGRRIAQLLLELSDRGAARSRKVHDDYATANDRAAETAGEDFEGVPLPFTEAQRAELSEIGEINRAAAVAKTHLQTGLMWLRRALTNPEAF